MATTYKVLGQANPLALTNTTLYTVPSSTQAMVSTITVANLGLVVVAYRIAVRPAGATLANQHYIAFDVDQYPKLAQTLTLGLALGADDVITVWAATNQLAFSAFGAEITP